MDEYRKPRAVRQRAPAVFAPGVVKLGPTPK